MSRLFLTLLNSSITASWLILAVFIIRLLLKKAPKWMICLLWGVVAVRLIVPFSIESALSLIPSAKTIPMDIEYLAAPTVNTGIAPVDQVVNPIIVEQFAPKEVGNSVNPMQVVTSFATVVWIVGFALMLLYAIIIYIRLNKRVSAAVKVQNHVYRCDEIDSPFILGVIRPRIYLPSNLDEGLYDNILSHEYAHLKRRDHYWKPLGYILLSVYWFNPLCWLSYIILCKDIELACDEKATKEMDKNQRALYCETLLACSVNRKLISVCPVAFGEVCVKERIKSVLNYKKPAFWIVLAAIVCCAAVVVCFLTNPVDDDGNEFTESGSNREVAIESTKGIERTESDELAGEKRAFIEKWASAFVDRDGQMIKDFSSEAVKEAFIERGLLYEEDDYVSFGMSSPWPMWNDEKTGYRIMQLDESANYAEILYYASTSEPHVIVWKEKIVFDAKDETMIVKDEELHYFDYIASGYEFNEAYPAIKGTLMDYSSNGLGEKLNDNALLSSSNIYKQLTDPVEAARILLNLLENENKVKIETLQYDNGADVQNIKITFAEDGVEKIITMIRPWGEYGIWIPQDYGKDAKPDIAEVVDRVLGEYDLADAYDWNNTVEFKTDEDILIKMAEDSTKRYEAYGVISAEYGSYGIILNDKTDGKNNVNYVYEPWFYTGAPADEPVLEWVDDKLLFVYPVEAGEFIQKQQLCYVDCGYETAHMSVVKFDESDLENQVQNMVDLEIDESDKVIRCTSKSNREVFAELSVRDVLPTDVSGELSFNQVFYNMDAQKLIVGVDALNTQTNRYVTMGYLAFDVDVESVSNGEADFTLSNPGTYEFGGIKEHGKNKEDGYASGIINTADVKVRQLPDENAEVIILLPKNQEITILEALENYYKINCVLEGDMVVEGYVMKEFIE